MERKAYSKMTEWKTDTHHKALLVKGCRQIGKTYTVTEFARENYDSYLYINLEERDDVRSVFEGRNRSGSEVLEELSFLSEAELIPGRSAIILDEIQSCISAYSALKGMVCENKYDIIASGSLLGIKIDDLQHITPMGYVDILEMGPMDFEEFLWAMGLDHDKTEYIRGCIQKKSPIGDAVCKRITDLFRRFMVVGGMPAAVLKYAETKNYSATRKILEDIISVIGQDAEKYSKHIQRFRIEACFRSVPEQLARDTGRFRYSNIEKKKGASQRMYGPSLLWLRRAGLVEYCHNIEEPSSPISLRTRQDMFKLYMADTGVLVTMMDPEVAGNIVNVDPYSNNGAIMENAVASALVRNGYPLRYYSRDDSTMEIDFIIYMGSDVTAVEVKSGRNKRAKSLRTLFSSNRNVRRAIKICDGNIGVDSDGVEHYPLFGPCFFPGPTVPDIGAPGDATDINEMISEEMSKTRTE